ncbi:ribosome maturation factor RimM [Caminicella sporogenes]|uniref:ribosome maturation factor RimM n=1 Tax=Caminicella sporogenes TaxID=166485 RepID=UPI0025418EDC|nr:ribosome maturation factor RimM [Caminicella sporogenes]WIF94618.1 ribosome maturation factor RimM [Caminicella sporogenes]
MGKRIVIGKIVNTQGIKGDVRIYPLTDYKERYEELEYIYIEGIDDKFEIENVRYKKELAIIKFKGLNNINDVEKYKNKYIYIDESQLRKLPEDTYYIFDLVGCNVYDEDNNLIGKLIDVIQNTAQDIYVVERLDEEDREKTKKVMIPAVEEFIKKIDIKNKSIIVHLIEGMLE